MKIFYLFKASKGYVGHANSFCHFPDYCKEFGKGKGKGIGTMIPKHGGERKND